MFMKLERITSAQLEKVLNQNDPYMVTELFRASKGCLCTKLASVLESDKSQNKACTLEEYLKNRLAKDSWVFLTYKDGYVDGFACFDICDEDPSVEVVKDIVICPLYDDEDAAIEYINFYFEQLFAQRFRLAKFEWEAKEGSVFEIAYDAVLVDWEGQRDAADGTVYYKAGSI